MDFTPEDSIAAARFLREQAVRLPHAQRRAALNFLHLMDGGVDIGPKFNDENEEVGGYILVSIPVTWGDMPIGSVDLSIVRPMFASTGEESRACDVYPVGNNFFRPNVPSMKVEN